MTELPQAFLSQMAAQLKGEMAAFLRTYDEPYQRGLRVNPWKRPTLLPDDCGERVPWEENGHYLALTSTAGADVLHEAGAWYLQEPSAMLPAGEMWSVVMKSPRSARTRASSTGCGAQGSSGMPSKYGARRT